MKILKNQFKIETETWDDPGDYPNNVESGPLPSYSYVCEIVGELLFEYDPRDLDEDIEEFFMEFANENADIPNGIHVTEWAWNYPKINQICMSVQSFDASGYVDESEPDYYDRDDFS
jgi:hypothetical protein